MFALACQAVLHHCPAAQRVISEAMDLAQELRLRYGCNPHQAPARASAVEGELPFRVLNGSPGYINLLDALNSWPLVKELSLATGLPAAASFKHVSPAGAAVAQEMADEERRAAMVEDMELSPLATAYARARGADRMSSFGDWAAVSHPLDTVTAELLRREVSDGIIAPGYEPGVLDILRRKRGGTYCVLEVDADYEPPATECRTVYGVRLEQPRNDFMPGDGFFDNVVTQRNDLDEDARRDLMVATIAVKYTQSNSVGLAYGGQSIGLGAGQQSRIHCTRLAAAKAETWWLRRHPKTQSLPFRDDAGRPERTNAVEEYIRAGERIDESAAWLECLTERPQPLTVEEKRQWMAGLRGVALSSDAFFPFRDNIDCAASVGVQFIVSPGGSVRDEDVIRAANECGMTMVFSGVRFFHH